MENSFELLLNSLIVEKNNNRNYSLEGFKDKFSLRQFLSFSSILETTFIKKTYNCVEDIETSQKFANVFWASELEQDDKIEKTILNNSYYVHIQGDKVCCQLSIVLGRSLIAYYFLSESHSFVVFWGGLYNRPIMVLDLHDQNIVVCYYSGIRPPVRKRMIDKCITVLYSVCYADFDAIKNKSPSLSSIGLLLDTSHIGHNWWNEVSGISSLSSMKLLNYVNKVFCYEDSDPYDVLREFNIKHKIVYLSNDDSTRFLLNSTSIVMLKFTKNKVNAKSFQLVLGRAPLYQKSLSLNSKKNVSLLLGLRLENRTLDDILEFYISVINFLANKYEKIEVVLDGNNISKGKNIKSAAGAENNVIDSQWLVFKEIKANIPNNVTLIPSIGKSLHDNLSDLIKTDFFIAPWGAGYAKYRWICNLPGIALTNNISLNNKKDLNIYGPEYVSNSSQVTWYIDGVKDLDENDLRTNFVVNRDSFNLFLNNTLGFDNVN